MIYVLSRGCGTCQGIVNLSGALQSAHDATTPAAIKAADTAVKERLYLIDKDGINGPTMEKLREETTANDTGTG